MGSKQTLHAKTQKGFRHPIEGTEPSVACWITQTAVVSGLGAESDTGCSWTPSPRHRGHEFRPVVNH